VHDALLDIAEGVQGDAELGGVGREGLDLGPRHRVGDRLIDVDGGNVVVFGGDGEVGSAHCAAVVAEAAKGLRAGDLMHEVQVDVQEIGRALFAYDDVLVPDLLRQRETHDPSGGSSDLTSRIVRHQYHFMDKSSGVGVLDKAALVLSALEGAPLSLAGLVDATGLPRPTAHRLACALEHHRLVARDVSGRFTLGPRLGELAAAAGEDRLLSSASTVLVTLRDATGESAQLYRRQGQQRICVAAAERMTGLRDSVPVGSALTMHAGSAAQVLLAWEDADRLHRGLRGAAFTAVTLAAVRRRGWAQSLGEREPGVASVSAPVRAPGGRVIAAVSVSGPVERVSRAAGPRYAEAVVAAAASLGAAIAAGD